MSETAASGIHRTIAAIATPAGRGGVGIVRVSGEKARDILNDLVPAWPETTPSHHLRLSRIVDPDGELIDESLVVLMEGPHSYTGEDVVEFQCHGGPVILRRVLDASLQAGAEPADPGEFTQRAYLNGRLDLTQAEAVADLINATSDAAHRLAMDHLQGSLGEAISGHVEALTEAMVLVESAIDFSHEEHVYQIERDEVLSRITGVTEGLEKLRARFDEGRRRREGVRAVILGATNAGKSTLFNRLHGTERAIVTSVAGTTRDFLEEEIHLRGVALRVIDTAGLRATEDEVEAIGIERSREMKERADVVVWVVDRSEPLASDVREELRRLQTNDIPVILVLNKSDLPSRLEENEIAFLSDFEHVLETSLVGDELEGLDRVVTALADIAEDLTSGEGVLLSRARHLKSVLKALESLERAESAVESGMEHELVALDLREGLDALGEIVGEVTTEDILHRIFAEFCVGK